jgi:tetratricopeptide (TPR) repeat protein
MLEILTLIQNDLYDDARALCGDDEEKLLVFYALTQQNHQVEALLKKKQSSFAYAWLKAEQGHYGDLLQLTFEPSLHANTAGLVHHQAELLMDLGSLFLSWQAVQSRDTEKGLRCLREAFGLFPTSHTAFKLAQALKQEGRLDEAKAVLIRALRLWPQSQKCKDLLRAIFLQMQDYIQADELV